MSFSPPFVKVALGTRGPLHFWAHLYAFTSLCALLFSALHRGAQRVAVVFGLALLGLTIESVQARGILAALEWKDLSCDLLGLAAGLLVGMLRPSAPLPAAAGTTRAQA